MLPNKHTSGVYFSSSWGLQQPPCLDVLQKITWLDEGYLTYKYVTHGRITKSVVAFYIMLIPVTRKLQNLHEQKQVMS